MNTHVIGVDIGGTNIRVALLNDKLEIERRETALTRRIEKAEDFLQQINEMIHKVSRDTNVDAIGIVLPAPWTKEMESISDIINIPCLENMTVEEIKKYFKAHQVYLENDVNVIALLEADCGAAQKENHSIYITISTGIGSGVVIDKQIYHGAHGYAGEIGSIIVEGKKVDECSPLERSLEALCSGKALEAESIRLYGEHATPKILFDRCKQGEKEAKELLEEWLDYLTTGLAAVIQLMDPDVVVLGGPIVLNNQWVVEKLEEEIREKVLGQLAKKIKIRVAQFGVDAGIIGAGYYALTQTKEEN